MKTEKERVPLIGLIIATRVEAAPLVEALGLEAHGESRFPVYKGDGIVLVISGIGKANAAMAVTYCCFAFHPQWIVNLGAAGSTKVSHGLGDVFHVTKVVEWDRPLLSSKGPHLHFPHVLKGFREAVLATQDRPVIDRSARDVIAPWADLVDMEGAAVVQAARKLATPCVLFKFVSDTPDHEKEADVIAHIREFGTVFCRFVTGSVFPALRSEGSL
jgi:adenosylhomocysteine nucleosidase